MTIAVTKLRYGLQLVHRVGQKETGDEVFSVTEDKGLAYARTQGILATNQSHDEIVRTKAEQNATELELRASSLTQQNNTLRNEITELRSRTEELERDRKAFLARTEVMNRQLDAALNKPAMQPVPGSARTTPQK